MITALIQGNLSFLGSFALASIVFLAIAMLVERFARRLSAASRHTIVFAALLVPPALLAAIAWIPQSAEVVDRNAPAVVTTQLASVAADRKPFDATVLVAVWLSGALLSLVRSARNALHWRSVRAFADEKDGFAVSRECVEPMVIGIVKPAIVLPALDYIESLTPAELETVFAHERAHIARRDNLIALIVQLICAFFWFDPLHRLARRRLMELRERACDEAVLERGCDADSYVAALARSCEAPFRSSAVACMSRLQLRERMEWIMSYESQRRLPARIVHLAIGVAIAVAAIAFALLAPSPNLTAAEATTAVDFGVRAPVRNDAYTGSVKFDSKPEVRTLTTSAGEPRRLDGTMTPPKVISRVEPVYPEEAKKEGIFGVVILGLTIKEDGSVSDLRVMKALAPALDKAALDAVSQWKFEPAQQEGKPVAVAFNLTIHFKLDE